MFPTRGGRLFYDSRRISNNWKTCCHNNVASSLCTRSRSFHPWFEGLVPAGTRLKGLWGERAGRQM